MDIDVRNVGDIPSPTPINVLDSYGRTVDCTAYDSFRIIMLGTDNEEIDLTGGTLDASAARLGRFTFTWPSVSIFTARGDYVFQLEMTGPNRREYTSPHVIRVRELGKVNR